MKIFQTKKANRSTYNLIIRDYVWFSGNKKQCGHQVRKIKKIRKEIGID